MKHGVVTGFLFNLSVLVLCILSGCSQTPGDAAVRGGHPQAGADLYLQEAELGRADAAFKLGLLVSQGRVSGERFKTGTYWFKRACELGEPVGCHNVGVAYEYGSADGIKIDYAEAAKYYRIAAEKGYIGSQYNFGSMYSNNYLPPDDVQGYTWMLLAEKAARACAKQELCKWILEDPPGHRTKLKTRLTEDQIKQAETLASSWKPR